jgi:ribosomal protein S18 acetylase RimI-like enzyme
VSKRSEIIVRRADSNDLGALAELFDAYRQFYKQPSDTAAARAFLAERIARDESALLIAEHAAETIGFVQMYPLFSSVRLGRTWLLNDLYVAPQARRRGAANALLDAACKFARERGALGLELETGRDNTGAQALYRGAGWSPGENLHFHLDFADQNAGVRA